MDFLLGCCFIGKKNRVVDTKKNLRGNKTNPDRKLKNGKYSGPIIFYPHINRKF